MSEILDKLIKSAGEHAHKVLLKNREESLTQFCHFVCRNGENLVIMCPWRSDIEKQLIKLELRRTSRKKDAIAAVFLCEAWISRQPIPLTSWHANRQTFTRPSEDPNRKEVVIAVATNGKERASALWQIVRDKPGGKIVSLVAEAFGAMEVGGDLLDGLIAT